jgi:hypothetical protein
MSIFRGVRSLSKTADTVKKKGCCNMVSANLVLSICICSLACAMMFFPGSIADIVAAIRDISQNSARYRTLYAQMANLEKRLAAAEAVAANCSKIASNGAPLSENALADVAADIETLLRRQNDFVASVGKHLKSHDAGIEQVNNTVVLLLYDINVLRQVVNDAAADFNTTKRLIDAFEKNAARFTAASATGDKKIRDNRATPTFGPEEPSAFENVIDDNDENEETDDGAAPLSFGMGGSLNPDGSTPVIVRPKDAPKVVFELHEEGFEKALQEGHQLVVMFYAPWCPHCKTSLGPFEIAGGQSEVGFARINGDEFPEVSFPASSCAHLTCVLCS